MGRRRRPSEIDCKFHPRCNNSRCKFNHPSRCDDWPDCPLDDDECDFFHPDENCRFGNRCRDPEECYFMHPGEEERYNRARQSSNGSRNHSHTSRVLLPLVSSISDDRIPSGWEKVDKIIYNPNEVLGNGSLGTTVFKGRFDERPVAVKRIHKEEFQMNLIDREVQLLRESDNHRNIVRYYTMETDKDFFYMALELCEHSLHDFITNKLDASTNKIELLKQVTEGIAHLHRNDILHRDLKPQNILLSKDANQKSGCAYRILIADFGLCKQMPTGQNSVSHTTPTGSSGWLAPEIYASHLPEEELVEIYPSGKPSVTKTCDVFSLGCVFYFVLTDGENPFGHMMRRQERVLLGKYDISLLKNKLDNTTVDIASQCIECMISHEYNLRPSIDAVLQHPYFWEDPRKLQFIADVSDRIMKEASESKINELLVYRAPDIIDKNWQNKIDPDFFEDKPIYHDIRGLLRLIRNSKNHFHNLSDNAQNLIEKHIPTEQEKQHYQSGILHYFTSRFPKFFMHAYNTMNICSCEIAFKDYYSEEMRQFFEKNNPLLFQQKTDIESLTNEVQKMNVQNSQDSCQKTVDDSRLIRAIKDVNNSVPPTDPMINQAVDMNAHEEPYSLSFRF